MSSPGEVAELLRESESAMALTGAGISVASGIPPFRGPDTGPFWSDLEAMKWAYRKAFDDNPEGWYETFFWPLYDARRALSPSLAHYALKDMVNASILDAVVTQNIDGLDRAAGTNENKLFEIHGNDRSFSCVDWKDCGYILSMEDWLMANDPGGLPRCPRDNRILKPDVLLFEEDDPSPALMRAYERGIGAICSANTLMLVGSSLEIREIDFWVSTFAKRGGAIAVIDPYETPADEYAQLVVRASAEETLPTIRDLVVG